MKTRVGINGFGRIGRLILKTIIERHQDEIEAMIADYLADTKKDTPSVKEPVINKQSFQSAQKDKINHRRKKRNNKKHFFEFRFDYDAGIIILLGSLANIIVLVISIWRLISGN